MNFVGLNALLVLSYLSCILHIGELEGWWYLRLKKLWEKWWAANYKTLCIKALSSLWISAYFIFWGKYLLHNLYIKVYTFHCLTFSYLQVNEKSRHFPSIQLSSFFCLNKGVTGDWQTLVGGICIMVQWKSQDWLIIFSAYTRSCHPPLSFSLFSFTTLQLVMCRELWAFWKQGLSFTHLNA